MLPLMLPSLQTFFIASTTLWTNSVQKLSYYLKLESGIYQSVIYLWTGTMLKGLIMSNQISLIREHFTSTQRQV